MRITSVRERQIPLGADIRNAYVDFSTMTASIVAVESDVVRDGKPVTGYGFSSPGRYAQGEIIRERAVPRLLRAAREELLDPGTGELDPVRANAVMFQGEKPGGHGDRSVALGAVDVAMWDLAAKLREQSLAQLVADRFGGGSVSQSVWVYAAGGYYQPGAGPEALVEELTGYREAGFEHVKLKIGGASLAEDAERVAAVVESVGDGAYVAVDANGRFDLDTALAYGRMLEPFGLLWYEEAGDPLDYALNAELSRSYAGSLATGENLFSVQDSRNLLRYGEMRPDRDWLQMDPALSYGPTEFFRMVADAEERGWPRGRFVPHGGHQLNLALAAGLGLGGTECYPGVFKPVGGFIDSTPVSAGRVKVLDHHGIGIEEKADLWRHFEDL
ncbi:enolase C-terminal domain-like protein [Streptomyces nanshensis]|uniref:Mandelate racemase n=1 Tax=Streptomyces nanshensis TaxID=518642 RepID=A0A1E7KXA3_9ACTN|nr:enolase C-terminal domain-like protein [Streptomyces nanshensis]OEV08562.1 mandelate racemase [Streptomyces nanshensis]